MVKQRRNCSRREIIGATRKKEGFSLVFIVSSGRNLSDIYDPSTKIGSSVSGTIKGILHRRERCAAIGKVFRISRMVVFFRCRFHSAKVVGGEAQGEVGRLRAKGDWDLANRARAEGEASLEACAEGCRYVSRPVRCRYELVGLVCVFLWMLSSSLASSSGSGDERQSRSAYPQVEHVRAAVLSQGELRHGKPLLRSIRRSKVDRSPMQRLFQSTAIFSSISPTIIT